MVVYLSNGHNQYSLPPGSTDDVYGNDGDDTIVGNAGNNLLDGGNGNDILSGDEVFGTIGGNDTLRGGPGEDNLNGRLGDDLLLCGENNDTANGQQGNDYIDGGEGNDILYGDVNIESVGFNDTLNGGTGADELWGFEGNDRIIADGSYAHGRDRLFGRGGDDVYILAGANFSMVAASAGDAGYDRLEIPVSIDISVWLGLEEVALTGSDAVNVSGNARANVLRGNEAANTLAGLGGSDTLYGFGGADILSGGDTGDFDDLYGGDGNDLFILVDEQDLPVELAYEGRDTVQSYHGYQLPDYVEVLQLLGSAVAGQGNGENNLIIGNAGGNILNGLSGRDTLQGGAGNDTYVLDDLSLRYVAGSLVGESRDRVDEAAGAGIDTVLVQRVASNFGGYSSLYALGDNLENARVTGSGDFDLGGNGLGNGLTGNGGANLLAGYGGADVIDGGAGYDTLDGGAGNDTYMLADASIYFQGFYRAGYDKVIEAENGGIDRVEVGRQPNPLTSGLFFTSYELGANLESARITGTGDFNVEGNAANNLITGNNAVNQISGWDGNDTIYGGGGDDFLNGRAGADTVYGGAGNDLITVSIGADRVIEFANQGIDRVDSPISWTLAVNLENLVLLGYTNIDGAGNGSDNSISGSFGNNELSGLGGADSLYGAPGADRLAGNLGSDFLVGGDGNDRFIYTLIGDSGPAVAARDVIEDFTAGDRIDVSAIDANSLTAGDQDFVLDQGGGFTAREIKQTVQGANLLLAFNVDGDADPEMAMLLHNRTDLLVAGDLVL